MPPPEQIEIRSPRRHFLMDVSAGWLRDEAGRNVSLSRNERALLAYFIDHSGDLLSKEDMQNNIWRRVVTDAAISQAVRELRRKLEDPSTVPEFIKTERGIGYRFVAQVLRKPKGVPAPGSEITHPTPAAVTPQENDPRNGWHISKPKDEPGLVELEFQHPIVKPPDDLIVRAGVRFGVATRPWRKHLVSIGLRCAHLSLKSDGYLIVQNTMIGERQASNTMRRGADRSVEIFGPTDEQGNLVGDPMGSEYIAIVKFRGAGEKSVSLFVAAAEWSFDIKRVSPEGENVSLTIGAEKRAILSALIRKNRPVDVQGRTIVARARMRWRKGK